MTSKLSRWSRFSLDIIKHRVTTEQYRYQECRIATLATPLWEGSKLKEVHKLKVFETWDLLGISTIGDITGKGELKTWAQLSQEYDLNNLQFIKYAQLRRAWQAEHIQGTNLPPCAFATAVCRAKAPPIFMIFLSPIIRRVTLGHRGLTWLKSLKSKEQKWVRVHLVIWQPKTGMHYLFFFE